MQYKKLFLLIMVMPSLVFGIAKEGEELQILDDLIASTERQVALQKELRDLIANFHQQQKTFQEGQQTKELALQMVQTASKIMRMAEDHHLMYLFPPFFIEELKLFSGIAKKKTPSP